jgi:hypothetical protein
VAKNINRLQFLYPTDCRAPPSEQRMGHKISAEVNIICMFVTQIGNSRVPRWDKLILRKRAKSGWQKISIGYSFLHPADCGVPPSEQRMGHERSPEVTIVCMSVA